MFNGHSFLIVNESKVIGIFSCLCEDEIRMGESISDSYSLQTCDFALILELLIFYFLTDSWGIFSSITLSKNKDRMISWEP